MSLKSPRLLVALALVALAVVGPMVAAERSAANMAAAANAFLDSLSSAQRAEATFEIQSDEREKFHFIPTEMFPRNGVTLIDMNAEQRMRAHDLLSSGLSQRGYLTATTVMELEGILSTIETNGRFDRNPEWYFFSVFGTPGPTGAWGWRVQGHHLSLDFTIVDGRSVAASPSFFGSNPAQVKEGRHAGLRALAGREDTARALVQALDASQRSTAIVAEEAPDDIITGAELEIDALSPAGLQASAMTDAQQEMLMDVIESYTSTMATDIAAERVAQVKEDWDSIGFAWAGGTERGDGHYYRVQGPSFLIEYDSTQGGGNHVHSVWRDFANDFGRDLLREHLAANDH